MIGARSFFVKVFYFQHISTRGMFQVGTLTIYSGLLFPVVFVLVSLDFIQFLLLL